MNNVASRTAKLREEVVSKVSGISAQEEENLMKTLRWLEFRDSKKLVEVEVHDDGYAVTEITEDTLPFTGPDQVFKTHDQALDRIVEIFRR